MAKSLERCALFEQLQTAFNRAVEDASKPGCCNGARCGIVAPHVEFGKTEYGDREAQLFWMLHELCVRVEEKDARYSQTLAALEGHVAGLVARLEGAPVLSSKESITTNFFPMPGESKEEFRDRILAVQPFPPATKLPETK
jgi:hypothetical protein